MSKKPRYVKALYNQWLEKVEDPTLLAELEAMADDETAINDAAKDANTITYQVRSELENSINAAKTEIGKKLEGYVDTGTYEDDRNEIDSNINDKFNESANQTQQVQNDANKRFDSIATYIRFDEDVMVAYTGADMQAKLDEEVIPYISSANVACGFHASDPLVMAQTVRLGVENHTAIGAHPGYPDLVGFGRRNMAVSAKELKAMVQYQVGALQAF